jgi:4-amino-4-deoxy-L-arabinose transferase-like glycosyltransferase
MTNNHKNIKKTKILLVCGVSLLAAVSASWTISEGTLGNHECFVSITAREMLVSGDWVWPTCNGQPRLLKTPLSYWLVAGLAKITGKVDEFTARLPSVIFGVLSVAAILYFVSQWLTFRIAVISGGVWATSLGYIRYCHNARPEMALTFFILLCFLSFYSAVTAKDRSKEVVYMLVFWTSFALANLTKGPAPLPLVLIPLFFYVSIFRRWKKLLNWVSVVGLIIFLAIVLPWPLAIAHKLHWNLGLWKVEFVDRFLGDYRPGGKPFYYYLLIMFQFIVPWVAFLPMALAAPFYRVWNKKRPFMQFLWLWFIVDMVFLTVSGGKRQHYILPLMPAMAMLIGILIEDMAFIRKAYSQKQAKGVLRNHIVVIIAGAIITPIVMQIVADRGPIHSVVTNSQILAAVLMLCAITVVVVVAAAVLFAKRKPALGLGVVFSGIVVLVMIGYVTFLNPLDYNRYSRDFSWRLAEIVPQSDNLIAYEYISNRSVQYFGRAIPEITDKSVLYNRYEQGDWVVATAGHLEVLQTDGKMKMVYYKQKAERRWQQDAPGALFHKSAPFVAKEP